MSLDIKSYRENVEYNMIVAHDINRGIGNNEKIPWYISEDLIYFRQLTENNIVVMGRKTYESIPLNRRPLKNRINIVLTNNPSLYENQHNLIYSDEKRLFYWINILNSTKVFFIGGAEIYKKWMNLVHNLYITYVNKSYECNIFFPPYENYFKLKNNIKSIYSEYEQCDVIFKHYVPK